MNFSKRQRTQRKQHSMKRSRLSFSSLLLFEVFCWRCLAGREVSDGCNYLGAPSALALTETESLSVLVLHCFCQNTFRWKYYRPWIDIVPKVALSGNVRWNFIKRTCFFGLDITASKDTLFYYFTFKTKLVLRTTFDY